MYQDEIFENALQETKAESLKQLQGEVKTVERGIERLLTQLFESTTFTTVRDFPTCGVC